MKRIIMSNYDKFIDGKHRNGGAYGYDTVFTLRETVRMRGCARAHPN